MKRSFVGASAAVLLTGATALAGASPAQAQSRPAPAAATVSYAGTVALSNCSGSLVRMPNSTAQDHALILSNGHCLTTGMPAPGKVVVNQSSTRTFTLLDSSARNLGTLRATKVAYATMTDTDVSLYELNTSYAAIRSQYGIDPLTVSPDHPVQGTAIKVVSGYWKRTYSCSIDGFVHELHEGGWTWKDSVRYTSACDTIGGTSGSPVIDTATGLLVAVNNTGNEDGARCTVDNPCEVDENGQVTVRQGINYAEQTYLLTSCFAPGNKLDLTLPGCRLPRP
ncbi:S1 family peptidase [Peterkaempfera bronchialis]|uniref:Serine protease n=1 Tax=Peterkaempfera bronchialis TaxID=2126346 RepID=A0A345T4A9_9ACTN|nr:serine protease [Peterkaempfera bronchialis]AXI80814.1 serine protease [Peterkaempfera bronchialis]